MRSIVVGTAGHIDHGKTSLVRALTGVDADRLPEEKRRGITIDLGFAELSFGDISIAFVDVPGHERFVKNMLAGAGAIDAVMLVIAADEGVMPQTREHFDICRLLGVSAGLVVLTKRDTVDFETIALARAEAEELVAGSFLEGAPILTLSARTGAGLEELKTALRDMALSVPERASETLTRLPIDRAFSMRGFGAIVTGTLLSGEIIENSEMEILPVGRRVRVRGVQVHNHASVRAVAGQRTAVNLGGIAVDEIERGHTLVAPVGSFQATQILDARVEILASAPRPLRSRARVRVHAGTAENLARVQVLEDAGQIAPGENGLVQLRFESPVVILPNDKFIIRSYSPQRTIGGGQALDIAATKHRGRERASAREFLSRLEKAKSFERFALLVERKGAHGLRRSQALAETGWRAEILNEAATRCVRENLILETDDTFIARRSFDELLSRAIDAVKDFHRREPLARGMARTTLREQVFARTSPEIFRRILERAEESGTLISDADVVRARSHNLELSVADAELRTALERAYKQAKLEIQTFDEILQRVNAKRRAPVNRTHARKMAQTLIDSGQIVRIEGEMFADAGAIKRLIEDLRLYVAEKSPGERLIDVAAFKELTGVSRKYAIPLLEYLDRERVTRRAGDRRLVL